MITLLILFFLFGNFVQKWYIPQGIDWGAGQIVIGDTDRDENWEFAFSTYGGSYTIYFYELQLPDTWLIDSVPNLNQPLLWALGDFDSDGFYDLVMQSSWGPPSVGIAIFESPDSFSYPTQEVWRDTVGPPLVLPISTYDIDQDGFAEIIKNRATPYGYIGIYESAGDNQYELIFADNPDTSGIEAPAATHACGDFDQDGTIECVFAGGNEWYWIYESPEDNTYEKVNQGQVQTLNIRDCFAVPDADGDGKLEFVVKGFVVPTARINVFIFEATGDNTYEIIESFDLFGGHNSYYGGYSDVGDIDGDGIPEIALEGCQNIYLLKAAGDDSFYVWETLPGNNSGSSVRVYDIDGNGLSEVVISGNNQTRIYEYEVGIAEEVGYQIQETRFEIYPIPIHDKVNIVYVLSKHSEVNISLIDATGRLIKELVNKSKGAGNYCELFDLADLSQGVYFIRFDSGDEKETKKVILLK